LLFLLDYLRTTYLSLKCCPVISDEIGWLRRAPLGAAIRFRISPTQMDGWRYRALISIVSTVIPFVPMSF
jgi:hypothetical protein